MIIVVSNIVELSVNKILSRISVRVKRIGQLTGPSLFVMELKCQLREIIFYKNYVAVTD